jgi:hypothetical protein
MKTAVFAIALLAGCASNKEDATPEMTPVRASTEGAEAPRDASGAPLPTISDSAPNSRTAMPPSRINVVPSVSPDKPLADAIGTSSEAPASLPATPATNADLAKGVGVDDPSGQQIGTIDSVTDSSVVLAVGKQRIQIPRNTIGRNEKGLVIGVTKAQLEAGLMTHQSNEP